MNKIRINKQTLLKKLKKNLKKHIADYEEAYAAYLVKLEEVLQEKIDNIRGHQKVDQEINLVVPESHASSYERGIEILKYSEDDVVEITMAEFRNYVQDEWDWKSHFTTSNSFYTGK